MACTALLEVIITLLGGKDDKFFLIHSLLCGSELGSFGKGALNILYLPLSCFIKLKRLFAFDVIGMLSQKSSLSLIFCNASSKSVISRQSFPTSFFQAPKKSARTPSMSTYISDSLLRSLAETSLIDSAMPRLNNLFGVEFFLAFLCNSFGLPFPKCNFFMFIYSPPTGTSFVAFCFVTIPTPAASVVGFKLYHLICRQSYY